MNQEEYMDLHALKNEGWTNKEISEELGFHPATVRKWLEAGGPPKRVVAPDGRRVMTAAYDMECPCWTRRGGQHEQRPHPMPSR